MACNESARPAGADKTKDRTAILATAALVASAVLLTLGLLFAAKQRAVATHPLSTDLVLVRFKGGDLRVPSNLFPDSSNLRALAPGQKTLLLHALLPDFAGRSTFNAKQFSEAGGGRVVIVLTTWFSSSRKETEPWIHHLWKTRNSRGVGYVDTTSEYRGLKYGLHHEGGRWWFNASADGSRKYGAEQEDDYYWWMDRQGRVTTLINCTPVEIAENLKGHEGYDPNRRQVSPSCNHQFFIDAIDAEVSLDYRRAYLKDWRQIQERAEALFASFIRPLPAKN